MADMMTFPDTWEEFEELYHITDTEQIYTNGARLIPSFRVEQWLEHMADRNSSENPNNSTRSKMEQVDQDTNVRSKDCETCANGEGDIEACGYCRHGDLYEPKTEPQTDCAWGRGE